MRLLIIQETDWIQRNPLQQHHLAEMLSLRGHEIRVIDYELLWRTQEKKGIFSRRQTFTNICKIYNNAKVTVVRPGIIKIPWLDYISLLFSHHGEIARQIKEFKPGIIVGMGILNSYLALKAARKNNLPFIYYWMDVLHWLIPFKPFQPLGKFIESRTLRQSDKIIVVSDRLKEFVTKLGAPPERIEVATPGISLKRFNPAISGETVRRQYGIKKDDVTLFFMGWLYHFSGLEKVALEMVRAKRENIKFLIVGDGDAFDDLQRIQKEHGAQNQIILAGHRPYEEMPGLIAAADICLLPADPTAKIMHDGLPGKIFEYLAMQKPMIATKLPAVMREFGEDNGVVYVERPQDVISKTLELVSTGQIEKLGLKARQYVENYDWEKITDQFERTLEETNNERQT